MTTLMRIVTVGFLVGTTGLVACEAAKPRSEPAEFVIADLDTLVRAEDEVLARPTELTLDERGLVYVLDAGDATIRVLDASGATVRTMGREGSGPGELRSPRSLRVAGDTIRVLDGGNGRVQLFGRDGAFLGTRPMPGPATSGAVAFSPDGSALVALNGADSCLAQRFSPSGDPGPRLGEPVAPPSAVWDFVAIKEEIRQGAVPAILRNIVHPVLTHGGAAWLLLQAEGRIQHYTAADSLSWDIVVDAPEFASIRQDFFERNRADDAPFRFTPLSYFVQGTVVAGELWVLLRTPETEPSLILVLGADGVLRKRIRFANAQGIRGFALDETRRFVYLLAYQEASLLRARVPGGAL